jgi:hypothetical protein
MAEENRASNASMTHKKEAAATITAAPTMQQKIVLAYKTQR